MVVRCFLRLPLVLILLSVLSASQTAKGFASRGSLLIAGPTGDPTADFTGQAAISQAVDAASEGSFVLVRTGTYAGFRIDGKAVSVFADDGSQVVLPDSLGTVVVANLNSLQQVVLAGLQISQDFLPIRPRVSVENCEGAVWIQDCEVTTTGGFF